ncbi:hypothetical protein GCM10023220_16360 [Streptomyces ziwulingensis]|uniref:Uncharacterized protein n=1 Tax=Streptomyces ziwulingensis TaxID=1045501 RepID=A0ABP9B7F9_9ACTN
MRVGITESLTQGEYGTLGSLIFREDDRGVWVEAQVQRRGIATLWTCRRGRW